MTIAEDDIFDLSPINSASDDYESDTGEEQNNKSGHGIEPKGKEVPVKELIKKKSVPQVLKIFRDRVNRRIKTVNLNNSVPSTSFFCY